MSFPAFQTPARPLPGAFVQTPAPSRFGAQNVNRQLFRTGSSSLAQPASSDAQGQDSQQAGALVNTAPQAPSLKPVQRAARTINEVLRKDANFPELDSYVKRMLCRMKSMRRAKANLAQRVSLQTMKFHPPWGKAPHGHHIKRPRCTIYPTRSLNNTTMRRFLRPWASLPS